MPSKHNEYLPLLVEHDLGLGLTASRVLVPAADQSMSAVDIEQASIGFLGRVDLQIELLGRSGAGGIIENDLAAHSRASATLAITAKSLLRHSKAYPFFPA